MNLTETGNVIFERTYSRPKPNGKKETWPETVQRVVDGNIALLDDPKLLPNEREDLIDMMTDFKIVPAGRHLWASGVQGAIHLNNCFRAGTEVHTDRGVFPIEKLVGSTVNALSQDQTYREATFKSYGEQELLKVTFAGGEVVYATRDHEWVTFNNGIVKKRTTTENLAGKRVPFNPAPKPEINGSFDEGFAHGVVYGDGTRSGNISTMISLFGEKRKLASYLAPYARHEVIEHEDYTYVGTLPGDWKELPNEAASRSYWRGFIAGLIATDGRVRKSNVEVFQSDKDALEAIRLGAMWAGFVTTGVSMYREKSPYTGEYAPAYVLRFRSWSVDEDDLIRDDQRWKFGIPRNAEYRTVRVQSVETTGIVEEVYCAEEMETHTITIGSGILTGQCWTSGWTERPSDHFEFTFMRLMEGGGVGANYSKIPDYGIVNDFFQVHIVCDPEHPDYDEMKDAGLLSEAYSYDWVGSFEIGDSREGWAEAVVDLIDTYYRTDVEHLFRVYDVSHVRPSGAKLKTFGGTASGPAPLAKALKSISGTLNDHGELTGMAAMDIDHALAECVVSGGVRRSARMAMMHWDDPEIFDFIDCKKSGISHWSTNISVVVDDEFWTQVRSGPLATAKRGFIAKTVLDAISEGMLKNGEPGFWDISLSSEGEPGEMYATNPCLTGDTVIATIDGPRTFADLAESGEDVEVYSWHPKTKTPVVRWMRNPRKTRENAELLKVTFDSGLVVRCTPDHSFYTFRGKKTKAKNLKVGSSIRAFSASYDGSGHERIHGWDSKRNGANHQWTHRMIWENEHGPIDDGMVIAHLDGDSSNNSLSNLAMMTPYEHASYDYPARLANGFHNRKKEDHPANHKIVSIEPGGYADVYNGTVDDSHTYVVLDPTPIAGHMSGIISANCGEITLEEWEPCNLGHVNPAAFVDEFGEADLIELRHAHKLMTRFLIRATFAPVTDPKSRKVIDRNRRIGVGHLGIASYLAMQGFRYSDVRNSFLEDDLNAWASSVDEAAQDYCHELRIPIPVKLRTVAPTGTIAKMPGVSEGVHPIFSKYFIRRIRFSTVDPAQMEQVEEFRRQGYNVVDDIYAANTVVVEIPTKDTLVQAVEDRGFDESVVEGADELTLDQMLDFQALYQELWADNAVSYTANIPADEYSVETMRGTLLRYAGRLKGCTVFPEATMELSPYERLSKDQFEYSIVQDVGDGVDDDCLMGCPVR